MKKLVLLTSLATCLSPFCVYSMEQEPQDWPDQFKNIWCPEMDQPIDAQDLLNHPDNAFLKQLSETDNQEQKDNYLKEALALCYRKNLLYQYLRKTFACALATGANPNQRAFEGPNPHHINRGPEKGPTLLLYSTKFNDYYLTEFALQKGADPNIDYDSFYRQPPLMLAQTKPMAELLIEYKANPMATSCYSTNVLYAVVRYDHSDELIPYYIKLGVDINQENEQKQTPLSAFLHVDRSWSNCSFNPKKLEIFLDYGARLYKDPKKKSKGLLKELKENLRKNYQEAEKVVKTYQDKKKKCYTLVSILRLFTPPKIE